MPWLFPCLIDALHSRGVDERRCLPEKPIQTLETVPGPGRNEMIVDLEYGLSSELISLSPPHGQGMRGCQHSAHGMRARRTSQDRHPSRQSFDTTRRIRSKTGSHLGSTLNPGGAVLTLGVFRRSRSVAYIRVDASPSEVHTNESHGSTRSRSASSRLPAGPRHSRISRRPVAVALRSRGTRIAVRCRSGGRRCSRRESPAFRALRPDSRGARCCSNRLPRARFPRGSPPGWPRPNSAAPTNARRTRLEPNPADGMPSLTPGTPIEPNGATAELYGTFGVSNGTHPGFPVPAPMGGSAAAGRFGDRHRIEIRHRSGDGLLDDGGARITG